MKLLHSNAKDAKVAVPGRLGSNMHRSVSMISVYVVCNQECCTVRSRLNRARHLQRT